MPSDGPVTRSRLLLAHGDPPADELEGEGAEHHQGGDGEADGGVEGVLADLPPAVGVEEQAAQGRTPEEGLDLTGELGVGGISLGAALTWE